ncbi:MAG: hypothetical protein WCJ64_21150 [Rhodospirillaceae bacterium]
MPADLMRPAPGAARPPIEPLIPPHRPDGAPTRRVGMTLDHTRYVRFRTFAAEHGLSGDDLAVIAVDRLLSGR